MAPKDFYNKYQDTSCRYRAPQYRDVLEPVVQVTQGKEYLDTRLMTDEQKEKLFHRMKQSKPELYNMIRTDGFIKMLVDTFDASLLIEKRKR